ncbi:MAG: hypothetical protein Q9164_001772 [Protoblastenia rupestris]
MRKSNENLILRVEISKIHPVPKDDNLPEGDVENTVQELDSVFSCMHYQNTEDFDPDQDTIDYDLSSNEALKPRNFFGLGEAYIAPPPKSVNQLPQLHTFRDPPNDAAAAAQYFERVGSAKSNHGCRTEAGLSPYLLIYSLTASANGNPDPKAGFLAMLTRYPYLTSDEDHVGSLK